MTTLHDVAVLGLGVMGSSLARNFASRGLKVAAFNRNPDVARALATAHPEANLGVATTYEALVAMLSRPRRIVVLVNAGAPVDDVLGKLAPLLEEGDVVVDAGNSLYTDTERRVEGFRERPWRFLGMGVSGGAEGALLGPALMPGGDLAAFETMRPLLDAIAARGAHGACVAYCGKGSAGHFVKMVHNGIEYGDMQLIAESVSLMRVGLGLPAKEVAAAFLRWNGGDLASYLVEITADILRTPDPEKADGSLLLDAILDQAGQKGTGRWTVVAAAEHSVPVPTIAAAVDARNLSAARPLRLRAAQALGAIQRPLDAVSANDVRDALYASKIASYAQGFALLAAASQSRGYGTDLAEVARGWTGGCIIRAALLERIMEAFRADPALDMLALTPFFAEALRRREAAWRRVIVAAARVGLPTPSLSASLAWFDTLRTARGSANVIQAQRDYFGSHTYERLDKPGIAVHTEWPRLGK